MSKKKSNRRATADKRRGAKSAKRAATLRDRRSADVGKVASALRMVQLIDIAADIAFRAGDAPVAGLFVGPDGCDVVFVISLTHVRSQALPVDASTATHFFLGACAKLVVGMIENDPSVAEILKFTSTDVGHALIEGAKARLTKAASEGTLEGEAADMYQLFFAHHETAAMPATPGAGPIPGE